MRMVSLELSGFRGFTTAQAFDLDADAIIIVGSNGNGKTSLFDAILWSLCGSIPRLGDDDAHIISQFSETGQARVALRFRPTNEGPLITITRLFDGEESRLTVEREPGTVLRGPEAQGLLIQLLWREAGAAARPSASLANVLTRTVYLQQDLVRQFIDSVSDHERFAAISELVGAGRVTELQRELERAKAAWSKATNAKAAELQPLRAHLSQMELRLGELKARSARGGGEIDSATWDSWWEEVAELDPAVSRVAFGARDAAIAIDVVIKRLDVLRRAAERRLEQLASLRDDLRNSNALVPPDLSELRDRIERLSKNRETANEQLTAEQERVAAARLRHATLADKAEQLRVLASIALKHLDERCPVCDQEYDREATRVRLTDLLAEGDEPTAAPDDSDAVRSLLEMVDSSERELAAAEMELRAAERTASDAKISQMRVQQLCKQSGVDYGAVVADPALVTKTIEEVATRVDAMHVAARAGEALALKMSAAADQATIAELEREIAATRGRLAAEDSDLVKRAATGEEAQRIIEALREAGSQVVAARISEIEPLLGNIFGRIDVHPAYNQVRLLSSIIRGKGQLTTRISDTQTAAKSDSPCAVLSSSQANALAVCVFLTLNLCVSQPPLKSLLLDDPLQSLDDIHLLGLVDLLRRAKDQRQLCVSTHDKRFGSLLARKLRPRNPSQRTIVIDLDSWNRTGPNVHVREIKCDPQPIRLAS